MSRVLRALRPRLGGPLVALALIVLAGVALRLWLISVNALDPRFSDADDGDYYRRALRLAVTGAYVDDAWLIRPPLHVFFFAGWLRLALLIGRPDLGVPLVQLAQVALAALTALAGYGVARRLFGSPRAGLIFAAFLALWYPFVEQPAVLFSELIYLALFLAHLWLLLRFDAGGRRRDLLLSGVALGLAALTRSPALYALALVAAWLWLRRPRGAPLRALAAQILIVSAGCLAIVLPWTARNYILYQHLIPVDTLGQINLWLDLDRVADRNANIEQLRGLPQAERAPYAMARARELLAENPLLPFDGMWLTFQHIWKAQFIEDYYVKQGFFARPLREAAWLGLPGDLAWLVLTLAGLVALAGPLREGLAWRLLFLAWLGYSLLTVLVFHVEPRYLLPLWTLTGLYGAGWLAGLGGARGPAAAGPRARTAHLAAQALVALGFLALVLSYRDYARIIVAGAAREQAASAADRAYLAGDYRAAEAGYRAALAAQPGFVDAQVGLALALAAQGRPEEARALIRPGASRRGDLVAAALARDLGDAGGARRLPRLETTAGEDSQRWSIAWLRPAPRRALALGDGRDLGYISGFLEAEQGPQGSYRWLSERGALRLPQPEPLRAGQTLALRLAGGQPGITSLAVRIGGQTQIVPVEGGRWRVYYLPIPASQAGAGELLVELRAPTFTPAMRDPASSDARALSVMVGEVRVQ